MVTWWNLQRPHVQDNDYVEVARQRACMKGWTPQRQGCKRRPSIQPHFSDWLLAAKALDSRN